MKYINTLITKHGTGDYALIIQGDDVTVKAFSHGYDMHPGNHINLSLSGVALEDMTELATFILTSVKEQREQEKREKISADEPTVKDTNYDTLMGAIHLAEQRYTIEYDQLPEYQRLDLYNMAERILRNNRINAANAREGK